MFIQLNLHRSSEGWKCHIGTILKLNRSDNAQFFPNVKEHIESHYVQENLEEKLTLLLERLLYQKKN